MAQTLVIYMAILSAWAFVAMGFDKKQAQKKKQRIPERNLWLLALLGGGIGAYFGMQVFHHKTRKTNFRVGFLLLAMLDIVILLVSSGFELPTSVIF
ncbi:DUF1294 domain-containing protein [Sporosarcina sp. GW1-11]|uniref:DUF1294 domain-containing protein n=1 Tax=Sporosarcina sp. GW1-11 TaxID=2899126 RepID=UPI00294CCC53|nr:DUF1294 domain-containing protein [Sporosarcina sp. GW1-11]MDV6378087.1 DUF1294 domain-containing protein [Sporosarcina sp. GW1-11]